MTKPESLVIRERLYPDMHESLVEVLGKYPRQAGNQVVLAMSEACLSLWPITEADYNVSDGAEFQKVKFTLTKARYPKLFALYRALPRGVKGQAIINLLNRHQMMRQADPGKVSDALNQALLGEGTSAARGPEHKAEAHHEVVSGRSAAEDDVPAVGSNVTKPLISAAAEAPEMQPAVKGEDPEEEIFDPLADLPPMEFS